MKPIKTEKAIMMIESRNIIVFEGRKEDSKRKIKEYLEELFDIKIKKIRTNIRKNKKYAYVQLKEESPAIDLATKLGIL